MTDQAERADLAELLMRASRGLRHQWAASLQPWDLSPHQARALRVVAELGSPRLGAVADRLRVTPRSVTEVIDALQDRGLTERVPDGSDRRAVCVVLTSRGEAVLAEIVAARRASAQAYFAPLTAAQQAELARLLTRLDEGD